MTTRAHTQTTDFIPMSELTGVQFYVLDENDNSIDACVEVTNKELFRNNIPFPNGVYDNRLGTTDNAYVCHTCFLTKNDCPGHFGKIVSAYPMVSPLFKKEVLKWLKITCFKCGHLLVKLGSRHVGIPRSARLNEAVKMSRSSQAKNLVCTNCNEIHPIVEKDPKDHLCINIRFGDTVRRINNIEIEDVLAKISDDSVIEMGKSLDAHPRRFTLRTLRVPPVTVRPDIKKIKGGRSNNDDLTTILKNFMSLIEKIPKVLTKELANDMMQTLDTLEMHYFTLIRDTPAGNTNRLQTNTGSNLMPITSRLPKKTGRVRKNILGKRTSYMTRSVISVDNIKAYEVGVPISICRKLQVPETVQPYNMDRLMVNFLNRDKQYPGCSKVVKKSGHAYNVSSIDDGFVLECGDVLYRDMQDGDMLAMNRAPSLLNSSISGHRVKVMPSGDTLRLSPNITDSYYGGDFDGDAMSGITPHSITARNESWFMSGIPQWCMALKDGSPSVGIYHDGLIGIFEFSKHGRELTKYNSMRLLANIDEFSEKSWCQEDRLYTSHQIVSKVLPSINYNLRAGFYKPEYADYIEYDTSDIKLEIVHGEFKCGRMDKKSVGQGVSGSLFHAIFNEKGSEEALRMVFNIQQLTNLFMIHHGCTMSMSDIALSKRAIDKVHEQTEAILLESEQITANLHSGKIVPPLGLTVAEFFEQQQLAVLNLGDEFLKPVFEDLNPESDNLFKLIVSGSKGKMTNLLQIKGSIGQASIGGERMAKLFDYERTCPYYPRFDESPQNRGFVPESYTTGVGMVSFIFQSMEARYSIINKALSTSITGEQNRKSIKNLESLMIDNHRKVSNRGRIIQCIFGGDGIDCRHNELNTFPTVSISDAEFDSKFKTLLTDVDKVFQHDQMKAILDAEFDQLKRDRDAYRYAFLHIEQQNTKNKMFDNSKNLPINPKRVVEDVCHMRDSNMVPHDDSPLNPADMIERVRTLCDDIRYIYYNKYMMASRAHVATHIDKAVTLMNISIRCWMNSKRLLALNVTKPMLDLVCDKLLFALSKSLVEYGMPIGIVSAQSISEPMTQYVLDSHHRTGASGTKTDFLGRMKEILGAKDTGKMKAPTMVIHVEPDVENDAFQMQQIANHIEMLPMRLFVDAYQIFFEKYNAIAHPAYKHESALITAFNKYSPLMRVPNDLLHWCVRMDISKEKLMEKTMKLETICLKINEMFPQLYVVNNAENADNIVIRLYFRSQHFKRTSVVNTTLIQQFIDSELLNTIIRGVNGINSTSTTSTIARSRIAEDGSVEKYSKPVIITDGTNLVDVFASNFVDPYNTQSDSILEIKDMLGIEAANNAIVIQLSSMMPSASAQYYRVYADVMTSTGEVSSIDRQGIQNRERDNPLLVMANSHPLQTIEDVAINSMSCRCDETFSPALMVGATPKHATKFNQIILNEDFIRSHVVDMNEQLDAL